MKNVDMGLYFAPNKPISLNRIWGVEHNALTGWEAFDESRRYGDFFRQLTVRPTKLLSILGESQSNNNETILKWNKKNPGNKREEITAHSTVPSMCVAVICSCWAKVFFR
jgi:hypothetical protein